MKKVISGIQQMGIGNRDVHKLWKWYREAFGMDIKIFEEAAEAPLMTKYTGGEVHSRNAALAMNMQGGGGFEIWQFTSRQAAEPEFTPEAGDLGIYIAKLRTINVEKAWHNFKKRNYNLAGPVQKDPTGEPHFYIYDPNGNLFEVVQNSYQFSKNDNLTAGIHGAVIGVSNVEQSLKLYRDVLGYDKIVYDKTDRFDDLTQLPGGDSEFRRVLLRNSKPRVGAFSKLLGPGEIELLQKTSGGGRKIFENRYWGDMGFIHLCFDIRNMDALKQECADEGFPFTIDSGDSFDMGEAAGRFAYIEDPDGALIEFVETHKLPVVAKWNLYLNIRNRPANKPLADWLLKALKFNRIKD